ncbi:MAG: Eco57I restriction-modification methylase domain-containing protein [Pyrinomonadaceae bacterium]|nr:Eco57I restriction-modification methylase domain-containing protein [Pyrinomonadaceae bacterium]
MDVEANRLLLQSELDTNRSSVERNKLGQFATPTALARHIVEYGLSLHQEGEKIRFLDPALGTGSFFSALVDRLGSRELEEARGFEIDPFYGEPAIRLWQGYPITIDLADFTVATPPNEPYNFIVCNPPYVRHHHIESKQKEHLRKVAGDISGLTLSGLAGLYCYFMIIAHRWMAPGAIAGWLVPSEFMDVNYGRELKQYLLTNVTLIRIHRFSPEDLQFSDALVSSAIVWLRNAPPPKAHATKFAFGGRLDAPLMSKTIESVTLRGEKKWTRFPFKATRGTSTEPVLSDLFKVKRGLATGDNGFFILPDATVERLSLPRQFCQPILPSPRHLDTSIIESDSNGNPLLESRLYLINCPLGESEVQQDFPALWRYLSAGKDALAEKYLCKTRKLWYLQEQRKPARFLCTYMGRGGKLDDRPVRFLLNRSNAVVTNSYLMLYPRPFLERILSDDPHTELELWRGLNDISGESLKAEGRVYGGGLHKLEPSELGNLPVGDLVDRLNIDLDNFALVFGATG